MTSLPAMSHASNLMQNYRPVTKAAPEASLVAIQNPNGLAELFTIGTNNQVYNFRPAEGSAYSEYALNVTATQIAAGLTASGKRIVFLLQTNDHYISYVTETGTDPVSWSQPLPCNLAGGPPTFFHAQNVGKTLYLCVFFYLGQQNKYEGPWQMDVYVWNEDATSQSLPQYVSFRTRLQNTSAGLGDPPAHPTMDRLGVAIREVNGQPTLFAAITPQLYLLWSNNYSKILSSSGLSAYRLTPPAGFSILGDYFTTSTSGPGQVTPPATSPQPGTVACVAAVDDPSSPPLLYPLTSGDMNCEGYLGSATLWNTAMNVGGDWCPCGSFASPSTTAPSVRAVAVRGDYVVQGKMSTSPLWQSGSTKLYSINPGLNGVNAQTSEVLDSGTGIQWNVYTPQNPAVRNVTTDTFIYSAALPTAPATGSSTPPDWKMSKLFPSPLTFAPLQAMSVAVNDGGPAAFSVAAGDRTIYYWCGDTQYSIASGLTLVDLVAATNPNGIFEMFAIDNGGGLYHSLQQPDGSFTLPFPIAAKIATFTLGKDAGGYSVVFACTTSGEVQRIYQDATTLDWHSAAVVIGHGSEVEEIETYKTDVVVRDLHGQPAIYQEVLLEPSTSAVLFVNGATYMADRKHPIRVRTNLAGVLSIAAKTNGLGTPALRVTSTWGVIDVEPSKGVRDTLRAQTAGSLAAAKDANGDYVLPQTVRENQNDLDALASALGECMSFQTQLEAAEQRRGGAGMMGAPAPEPAPFADELVTAGLPEKHWELDLSSGHAVFRYLSPTEALAAAPAPVAAAPAEASSSHSLTWGDIWNALKRGIAKLKKIAVSVAEKITATVTFLLNGIQYVFRQSAGLLQQLFDIVEGVFSWAGAAIQKLFGWLGFVFSWGDILRTQDALLGAYDNGMAALQEKISDIKTLFDKTMVSLEGKVSGYFDQLLEKAPQQGASTLGQVKAETEDKLPQSGKSALAVSSGTNIVLDCVLNQIGSPTASFPAGPTGDPPRSESWMSKLTDLWVQFQKSESYKQVKAFMEELVEKKGNLADVPTERLLRLAQAVAVDGLKAAQAIGDALFDTASGLISAFQKMAAEEWNVPFLSGLFKRIDNQRGMSLLNILSLVLAIPITVMFKALANKAPFEDDASVQQFIAAHRKGQIVPSSATETEKRSVKGLDIAALVLRWVDTFTVPISAGIMAFIDALVGCKNQLAAGVTLPAWFPTETALDKMILWLSVLHVGVDAVGLLVATPLGDAAFGSGVQISSFVVATVRWGVAILGWLLDVGALFVPDVVSLLADEAGRWVVCVLSAAETGLSVASTVLGIVEGSDLVVTSLQCYADMGVGFSGILQPLNSVAWKAAGPLVQAGASALLVMFDASAGGTYLVIGVTNSILETVSLAG